jgi:hypothetical protein
VRLDLVTDRVRAGILPHLPAPFKVLAEEDGCGIHRNQKE